MEYIYRARVYAYVCILQHSFGNCMFSGRSRVASNSFHHVVRKFKVGYPQIEGIGNLKNVEVAELGVNYAIVINGCTASGCDEAWLLIIQV